MSDVTQWEFDEQRAMEQEITRLRAELTEARKPDCRMCVFRFPLKNQCALDDGLSTPCVDGSRFKFIEPNMTKDPLRLYEKESIAQESAATATRLWGGDAHEM